MPAAVIGAIGGIAAAVISSNATTQAANDQAASAQQGLAFQQQVYGNTVKNLQPWVTGGQGALSSLEGLYGLPGGNPGGAQAAYQNYTNTPAYQFPYQQGLLALDRSQAANGLLLSGGQLQAAQQYGQGFASGNFNNYVNQLFNLSQAGQNSAALTGQQGNQAAQTSLSALLASGNAQAAGALGGAAAQTGQISALTNYLTNTNNQTGTSYAQQFGNWLGIGGGGSAGSNLSVGGGIDTAGDNLLSGMGQ